MIFRNANIKEDPKYNVDGFLKVEKERYDYHVKIVHFAKEAIAELEKGELVPELKDQIEEIAFKSASGGGAYFLFLKMKGHKPYTFTKEGNDLENAVKRLEETKYFDDAGRVWSDHDMGRLGYAMELRLRTNRIS